MGARYKVETPAEPPVGTMVEYIANGAKYRRMGADFLGAGRTGWFFVDSAGEIGDVAYSWSDILERGEVEDVTPEKTWSLPEPPPIGTYVVAYMANGYRGNIFVHMNDGPNTAAYFWTPAVARTWGELLAEYREVHEYRGPSPMENDLSSWITERG